jgi:hypothetical protein
MQTIEENENSVRLRSRALGKEIHHDCEIEGLWKEAFLRNPQSGNLAAQFGVRFPQIDTYPIDISDVPQSILVIPFLTNVLPIAWCYGATIYVEEVDLDFFEAQKMWQRAFQDYYPKLNISGGIVAERCVDNRIKEPKTAPLVLFSGGVDATFSLWGNHALKPHLVSIQGADVYCSPADNVAWDLISARHEKIANELGSNYYSIESSFKTWLAVWKLNVFAKQAGGWNWWFNLQQGSSLIGLCAPLAWKLQSKRIIISSSFSCNDEVYTPCGSNPSMDETIRYFGATSQHYDFTVSRQEKLAFLCQEASLRGVEIPLRVCWKERTGYNCCKCEKCLRTIFGILAEDAEPKLFGFDATSEELTAYIQDPEFKMGVFWIEVIKRLRNSSSVSLPHVKAALLKASEPASAPHSSHT